MMRVIVIECSGAPSGLQETLDTTQTPAGRLMPSATFKTWRPLSRAKIRAMPAFQPDVARLRGVVQTLIEEHHLPGVGIGVVQGSELTHAEGFGHADIVAGKAYRPDARHRIGSITKTMVSLCLMALVDEGRLSLDNRVADLLPDIEFKGHGETLTVWHLLTHTGGIGETPNPEDLKKPFDLLFYETDPNVPLADLYV